MFVPLNMIALRHRCRRRCAPKARPCGRLIRNLGSSIGVSIVIANLTNKTIVMHARLTESVTPFNQAMADPAAAMLDPTTDTGRALLENLITQQATIIAYANDFKLMMVMTLLAFSAGAADPGTKRGIQFSARRRGGRPLSPAGWADYDGRGQTPRRRTLAILNSSTGGEGLTPSTPCQAHTRSSVDDVLQRLARRWAASGAARSARWLWARFPPRCAG